MVKLNKIYTRTGDDGTTGLVGGMRVDKHSLRPDAFGAVDEVNACIGLCRLYVEDKAMDAILNHIQNDLFDLGSDLATSQDDTKRQGLRITDKQVKWLEEQIDNMNKELKPLESFVLPGGAKVSAYIHLARTQARNAERKMTKLARKENVNTHAMHYINRLSDQLFVMARFLNNKGDSDVLWQPGLNR